MYQPPAPPRANRRRRPSGLEGLPRLASRAFLAAFLALGLSGCDTHDHAGEAGASGGGGEARAVAERLGLHGSPLSAPLPRPRFVLTDTSGELYDFHARTQGRLTLLFFGYTSCPDICPIQLSNLAGALRQDPELGAQVEVVFVGVDAPRDTPERMRSWLDHFGEGFVGLTGDELALERAQRAAAVPAAYVESEFEGGYAVSHAGWVLVILPDDQLRLRYLPKVGPEEWAHDLRVLTEEEWPG